VLGKKAKKAKDAAPDLKEVAGREIDKAMKEAAKGRGPATTQASSSPAPDSDAVMEVVEVVLKGGAGFTVRALDDSDDEPLLARDGKLLMFANLRDLGDFAAEGGDHTLTARQGWDAIADAARSGSLAPELLDSYDLTEVPDLADGTAEDRWTAGLLVGYAIDVADTVGCPSLEALKPDSALLTLEREPEAFEGGKHAATLREKLIQEARSVWPKVLRDIESRSVWWSVLGTSGAPTAEKAKQDEALRLAQAEAAVATLNEGLPAEPAFVIPSRTPEGKGVTTIAPQQEPAAPAYDWDAVGAFPVEIRLPRGKGVTLVAYPDDESTMFLGGHGHQRGQRQDDQRGAQHRGVLRRDRPVQHELEAQPEHDGPGQLDQQQDAEDADLQAVRTEVAEEGAHRDGHGPRQRQRTRRARSSGYSTRTGHYSGVAASRKGRRLVHRALPDRTGAGRPCSLF
jgi:hypothetical protein